jgi:hypothetical protein
MSIAIPPSVFNLSPFKLGALGVANLATMLAYSSTKMTASTTFALNGILTTGDGGQGQFDYFPSSTAVPDGGVVFAPNNLLTSVSGASMGAGDGSTTTFTGTFSNTHINPGSVSVVNGSLTLTDTGAGTLFATSSAGATVNANGWVNYATGAWSVTFASAPANA